MSTGKYSPNLPKKDSYEFNAYGKPCAPWNMELKEQGVIYDELTMFGNYDDEGFDSYGYSAFDADGKYVGIGDGVDRDGLTEYDYLVRSNEEYDYWDPDHSDDDDDDQ